MRLSQDITPHDHAFGPPSRAEVVLVEYGDFECPYSKRAHAAVKDLTSWYGNLLAIVFRHFPQSTIHPHARLAAEAAEAANSQGLFWEMHDYLFRINSCSTGSTCCATPSNLVLTCPNSLPN
jgi:protein-disulfide isomerase